MASELGPSVASGQLALRIRLRYNHRLESSRFASEMLVASAAQGSLGHALPYLIGISQADTEERLRGRWNVASNFQPGPIDTLRQLIPEAITLRLQSDMAWIEEQQLLRLATPVMVLSGPDGLRQIHSQDLPLQEILNTIAAEEAANTGE